MPVVSVIVPCYNEEKTIRMLLEAILAQSYPVDKMEIVIVDGLSTDGTRQKISAFQNEHPELEIVVVDNPKRMIPTALNLAIKAARGEWIIRLDAHSAPRSDYVERCVIALEQGSGDSVGGVWDIHPGGKNWQARGIAAAAAHPLGVGDAHYRYTDTAQAVDTVPFGAFHRSLVEKIGFFDENLLANEDYEFNTRVRQAGGKIWLDPAIRSVYFARSSYPALARQYWRYGYWKARMLKRYPGTVRWRQALPPLFVLSLLGLAVLSLFTPLAAGLFVIELFSYVLVMFAVGLQVSWKRRDLAFIFSVPLAIATMHIAWGSAFLWSVILK
jgi:glycosyltransferase involved in cell wall biosynthesis